MAFKIPGFELGTTRPWIGSIFLAVALAWFGSVFYVMRPDLPRVDPRPTPYITLEDGKRYKVYLPEEVLGAQANWVEGVDVKTQYTSWDFMHRPLIRFLIIAVGPIFAVLTAAFVWLGIAEWWIRRRYGIIVSRY